MSAETKQLTNLTLLRNGIICNSNGHVVARLVAGIDFHSAQLANHVQEFNPIIDTCDFGHKYAKLEDHPKDKNGHPRCPTCISSDLDMSRKKFDWFVKWFKEGRKRAEIVPNGHIQPYTEIDIDVAIENLVK